MSLTAVQIQSNWKVFLNNIETHISDKKDRKQKFLISIKDMRRG